MPTVFRHNGFRFFFYSNEGNPREPVHIHVRKGGGEAKFRVEPDVSLAASVGLDAGTLRRLAVVVAEREKVEISPFGLHWPEIDEDISVAGLLAGKGDVTAMGSEAA